MKEKFLLADLNSSELLKTLAYHGRNTIGLRVFSGYELAEEALIRNGIVTKSILKKSNEVYTVSSFIDDIPYFSSSTFTDSKNLSDALHTLRQLIKENEYEEIHTAFKSDNFPEKNDAIIKAYDLYKGSLDNKQDTIDIIRKAIDECEPLNVDFIRLKEFPLTPLEERLLDKLSEGKYKEISLAELMGKEESGYRNIEYIKAYGDSNEVENVIDHIYINRLPLDSCTVVLSDTNKFGTLFYEYAQKLAIPVTFGCGVSISESNPAKLLKLYEFWDSNGYHGIDALIDMIFSPYFNLEKLFEKIGDRDKNEYLLAENLKQAGRLKIDTDQKTNQIKLEEFKTTVYVNEKWYRENYLDTIVEELGKGCSYFIEEYSLIRPGTIDESALYTIVNDINTYQDYMDYVNKISSYRDILEELMNKKVGRQTASEGKLHICDIKNAFSNLRDHIFVVGLSANNFPGSPKENYLLLDEDLKKFGDNVPTSDRIIENKKNLLYDLISLCSCLNMDIRLSYSSYGMSELKTENPSSVLFEIYKKQHGGNSSINDFNSSLKETGYFDNHLSVTRDLGLSYNKGDKILPKIPQGDIHDMPFKGERKFSPTNIEDFFVCPKMFYLRRILKIEEPDPDDPFVVIDARDLGTLAHSMMEYLANKDISKDEFIAYCNASFSNFLKYRIPLHDNEAKKARLEFLEMMSRSYDGDPHNEVMAAEEKVTVGHPSGILLYGYPDSVEKDKDGNYLIADFKTKRNYEHIENDIMTCLQVVLYAYMIAHKKNNPLPISYCEYRYLRYGSTIKCAYNETFENKLNELLMQVCEAMDTGEYPCADDKEACRYCKYGLICGKTMAKSEEE